MPLPPGNTLPKKERLCGKKDISTLLARGHFIPGQFLRCCWLRTSSGERRMMVSVSKRLFKRAVKRNLLKRRIRESYRLNKELLSIPEGVDILFIYNSKEVADFQQIQQAVRTLMEKVSHKCGENQTNAADTDEK